MPKEVEESEFEGEEDQGEAGEDGTLVKKNPIGDYRGHRNDKNERHGRGRAELPNGDLYLGCYYRGQRHGLGVYRYKNGNGARYGGDWTFGVKKGWGTMYYPDAGQYTGNWDRNLRHGWGVYVYPNGDEYEGWWYYGKRNGRGIYRTKASGEKFVGEWRLGQRQGPGMIIRKNHRFIGNWYNDAPKGPGVYIFPELQCEQHGKYTHMKCRPGGEERWTFDGYQVRQLRAAPPIEDPIGLEKQHQTIIERTPEVAGEGTLEELKAQQPDSIEDRVFKYMMQKIQDESIVDESKIPVVAMWRAFEITGLITPIPDESVPPPPMPPTPLPPPEPEPEVPVEEGADKAKAEGSEDPIMLARKLAETHALQLTYHGQGVCQSDTITVKLPTEIEPYSNYSVMSLSNMDEMRATVEATGGQLEPIDIEAAMRENQAMMRGHGMDVADRWRSCLAADGTCEVPEAPAPPGGVTAENPPATSMLPNYQNQEQPTTAETDHGHDQSGYEEEDISEATNLMGDTTEDEEEEYTTDDY